MDFASMTRMDRESVSPPRASGRRAVVGFRFRSEARHMQAMPHVGANGARGIIKRLDWPAWRVRMATSALPAPGDLEEPFEALAARVGSAELRSLRWVGAEAATAKRALDIVAIPRILAENGWFESRLRPAKKPRVAAPDSVAPSPSPTNKEDEASREDPARRPYDKFTKGSRVRIVRSRHGDELLTPLGVGTIVKLLHNGYRHVLLDGALEAKSFRPLQLELECAKRKEPSKPPPSKPQINFGKGALGDRDQRKPKFGKGAPGDRVQIVGDRDPSIALKFGTLTTAPVNKWRYVVIDGETKPRHFEENELLFVSSSSSSARVERVVVVKREEGTQQRDGLPPAADDKKSAFAVGKRARVVTESGFEVGIITAINRGWRTVRFEDGRRIKRCRFDALRSVEDPPTDKAPVTRNKEKRAVVKFKGRGTPAFGSISGYAALADLAYVVLDGETAPKAFRLRELGAPPPKVKEQGLVENRTDESRRRCDGDSEPADVLSVEPVRKIRSDGNPKQNSGVNPGRLTAQCPDAQDDDDDDDDQGATTEFSTRFVGPPPLSRDLVVGRKVKAKWVDIEGPYTATIAGLYPKDAAVDLQFEDGDFWERAPATAVLSYL